MSQRTGRRSFVTGCFGAALAAFVIVGSSGLTGCGGGDSGDDAAGGGGTLSLPILADVAGTPYRLSNASFTVSQTGAAPAEPVTLRTADMPAALALQQALPPGQYSVELEPGWALERQTSGGFEPVAGATLTSGSTLPISVVQGQIARVGFVFNAGGTTVDFQQAADDGDESYD